MRGCIQGLSGVVLALQTLILDSGSVRGVSPSLDRVIAEKW